MHELAGASLQVAALRKHMKILEERLRSERHSHAVKFSEIEKQLIQENAKLKVGSCFCRKISFHIIHLFQTIHVYNTINFFPR